MVINFRDTSAEASGNTPTPVPAPKPAPESTETNPETVTPGTSIYPAQIFDKKMTRKGCYRDDSDDR